MSLERVVQYPKKICLGLPLEFYFLEKKTIRKAIENFMVTHICHGKSIFHGIACPNVDVRAQGQGVMIDFLITRERDIEIKQAKGVSLREQQLKEVLITRQLKIINQVYHLNTAIDMVVNEYVAYLIHELKTKFRQSMNDGNKFIVAGGGAYYLEKSFKSLFPKIYLHIPDQTDFANARGYLKKLR